MMETVQFAMRQLDAELVRIESCLRRLDAQKVWTRLKGSANSVGNLCLHLAGAEYQRFVSAIGGKPLVRRRTEEFTAAGTHSPEELLELLREVREQSKAVVAALQPADLGREIEVFFDPDDWKRMLAHQPKYGEHPAYKPQKILYVILGAANHYSYHTGQIVYMTKLLQDGDGHLLDWKH